MVSLIQPIDGLVQIVIFRHLPHDCLEDFRGNVSRQPGDADHKVGRGLFDQDAFIWVGGLVLVGEGDGGRAQDLFGEAELFSGRGGAGINGIQ